MIYYSRCCDNFIIDVQLFNINYFEFPTETYFAKPIYCVKTAGNPLVHSYRYNLSKPDVYTSCKNWLYCYKNLIINKRVSVSFQKNTKKICTCIKRSTQVLMYSILVFIIIIIINAPTVVQSTLQYWFSSRYVFQSGGWQLVAYIKRAVTQNN